MIGKFSVLKKKFFKTDKGHEINAYFFRNFGVYHGTKTTGKCGAEHPLALRNLPFHDMIEKEMGENFRRSKKAFLEISVGPVATNLIKLCRLYNTYSCIGIDRSPLSVGINQLLEPRMNFFIADTNSFMGLRNQAYDMVFQVFSIYWNMQRKLLLQQIDMSLKVGGVFAHAGPCGCTQGCRVKNVKSLNSSTA